MRAHLAAAVLLAFAGLACGGQRGGGKVPTSASPSWPQRGGVVDDQPAVVPDTSDQPAPWLAPPLDDEPKDPLAGLVTVATGRHVALLRSSAGVVLAADDRRGAVGVLTPPAGAVWLGLDVADRVYAADAAGKLWVADAVDRPFSARGQVKGAVAWDVTQLLVATDGKRVHVSRDGGKRFTASTPAPDERLEQVLARVDGVLVARGQATWISRDGGATWARSAFQPAGALARRGADVQRPGCASLSTDGETWVSVADWDGEGAVEEEYFPAWQDLVDPDTQVLPALPPRLPNAWTPRAAEVPAPGRELEGDEVCPPWVEPDPEDVYEDESREYRGDCAGPDCLLLAPTAPVPPGPVKLAFLGDGICNTVVVDGVHECVEEITAPRSPPPLVALDLVHGTVKNVALPPDCVWPDWTASLGGLHLVACLADDVTTLWVADVPGEWREELRVQYLLRPTMQLAGDGTLLLDAGCGATAPGLAPDPAAGDEPPAEPSCGAFVRPPLAPSEAPEWMHIEIPRAVAYRALPGGAALVAVARDDRRVDLELVRAGAASRTVAQAVAVPEDVHAFAVTGEGHVRLEASGASWLVGERGTLLPGPCYSASKCTSMPK
jgi:hypothetical protein